MLLDLNGLSVTLFHDQFLARQELAISGNYAGVWQWVEINHYHNTMLWNEEDKARCMDVDPTAIVTCKRLIDQYNQKRNDAIEAMDEMLLRQFDGAKPGPDARLSSETAGSMIDRLSIISLKIYHMRDQTERKDATPEHIETCKAKLQRLTAQRDDLAFCLDRLLAEAEIGVAYFKIYRQFKMYNDPTLNPYLYQQQPMHTAS